MSAILDQLLADMQANRVLPGDAVLYCYKRLGPLQLGIANVQRRALADLPVRSPGFSLPAQDDPSPQSAIANRQSEIAKFTHAGMVLDAGRTVEMTSPRARLYPWSLRLEGVAEVAVVRPAVDCDRALMRQAATEGYDDVLHAVRYPYREILVYWLWSWGVQKLARGRKFSEIFRDGSRNVCSGSVIDWWKRAGVPLGLEGLDAYPEAWYPARFLVDPRFRLVACYRQA